MLERGVIRNRVAAQQIRDFSGLRFGKITPTDIDGFIDFGDRLFVFIEGKFKGAALSGGQMLALQRLTDAVHCPPRRYSVAFIVDHYEQGSDVDYAKCPVRKFRFSGEWRKPLVHGLTLLSAIERMRHYVDKPPRLRIA